MELIEWILFIIIFIIIIAFIVLYATGVVGRFGEIGPTGPTGISGTAVNTGATGPVGPTGGFKDFAQMSFTIGTTAMPITVAPQALIPFGNVTTFGSISYNGVLLTMGNAGVYQIAFGYGLVQSGSLQSVSLLVNDHIMPQWTLQESDDHGGSCTVLLTLTANTTLSLQNTATNNLLFFNTVSKNTPTNTGAIAAYLNVMRVM